VGRAEDEVPALGATAESGSEHLLARVIVEEAQRRDLAIPASADAHVLPGRGAQCHVKGTTIRAGSAAFLAEKGIGDTGRLLEEADRPEATALLVAVDRTLAGAILLRDSLRAGRPGGRNAATSCAQEGQSAARCRWMACASSGSDRPSA